MTKTRGIIYAVIAIVGLAYLWVQRHGADRRTETAIKSTTLPTNDADKFIVLPGRHEIEIVSRDTNGKTRVKDRFLPDSGGSIEVEKSGEVVFTSRAWGTEVRPYLGGALGSDIHGRAALGLNLFYVQRWEIGGGLLVNTNIHDTRLFLGGTYNVYGNMLVGVAIDNKRTAHVLVGLKF